MSIQHKDILDPQIHEPKGISSAAVDTVYVGTGTGSGTWKKIPITSLSGTTGTGTAGQSLVSTGDGNVTTKWGTARGSTSFVNIASPYVLTFPTAYAKANPTTTAGGSPIEVTETVNARLSYAGSADRKGIIDAEVCLSQASGASRDLRMAIFKNGTLIAISETIVTAATAEKKQLCISVETSLTNGDYFEVYLKNDGASGDISVYTYRMSVTAF